MTYNPIRHPRKPKGNPHQCLTTGVPLTGQGGTLICVSLQKLIWGANSIPSVLKCKGPLTLFLSFLITQMKHE